MKRKLDDEGCKEPPPDNGAVVSLAAPLLAGTVCKTQSDSEEIGRSTLDGVQGQAEAGATIMPDTEDALERTILDIFSSKKWLAGTYGDNKKGGETNGRTWPDSYNTER
ncbi:hypothetical protein CYMTET_34202 [Cymbomonas tetramitiformis]|uniref:Uncharacterized protein n=1 Tax=Cymbomonas tetramitiformis TaxID=36881 RepID=A0AAE0KQ69_9CHLO|nr:hypothetical protein CYMTET_34202 [Cymbomonas tetramitiformis]